MKNIVCEFEKRFLKKDLVNIKSGDTVSVKLIIKESNRIRKQIFEGFVIAKRNRGLNSSFTLRKVSNGEGIERVFKIHSPTIENISILRRGDVRKAKLYYLRSRFGKSAKIREKVIRKKIIIKKKK